MSEYTPTTEDVRDAWLTAEYEERDWGTSDDDLHAEFDRWLQTVKAEVWDEALKHVERLSDPASTIYIFPERELITLVDVTQAREENPYTKENNA